MILIRRLSVREHFPESDAIAPDITGVGEGAVIDGLRGIPGGEEGEEREDDERGGRMNRGERRGRGRMKRGEREGEEREDEEGGGRMMRGEGG